jgi:hypothetical protein
MYIKETKTMALFDFKKGSVSVGRKLNTAVGTNGGLGNIVIQMGSQAQNGKKGKYYIPMIQVLPPDEELLKEARAFMR